METNDIYKQTVIEMGRDAYSEILRDLARFINSHGLESFGAGISGIGNSDLELAKKVLRFIYIENAKADLDALEK